VGDTTGEKKLSSAPVGVEEYTGVQDVLKKEEGASDEAVKNFRDNKISKRSQRKYKNII
jgi:hypothetical protein